MLHVPIEASLGYFRVGVKGMYTVVISCTGSLLWIVHTFDKTSMIKDEGLIKGWPDLAKLVRQHFKKGWIYRGVRRCDYGLRPGIGRDKARKDATTGLNLPYSIEEEKKQLRQFGVILESGVQGLI